MKRKKKKSLTKWKEELDRERRSVQSRSKTYWEKKKKTQILIIQRSLKEIAINLPFDFLYANPFLDHNERKAI